jgi:hypothetical protein
MVNTPAIQPRQASGVGQLPAQQAVTPHIPLTGPQFDDYCDQAQANRGRAVTPEHLRHEEIGYSEVRINPDGFAPDIPVVATPLDINRPITALAEGAEVGGATVSLAADVDPLIALATLAQRIDPELAQLTNDVITERTVLAQGAS